MSGLGATGKVEAALAVQLVRDLRIALLHESRMNSGTCGVTPFAPWGARELAPVRQNSA
jgi:hypothetical protein